MTATLNHTSHVNHGDSKLKAPSKCKDDIIENAQVRNRKRRRRQIVDTVDARETGKDSD